MKSFKKDIVVTEQEWNRFQAEFWQQELDAWAQEGYHDPKREQFYVSGNLKVFLEASLAEGRAASWGWVLTCNPSRDFDHLLENIQHFWDWVLADSENRLPNRSDGRTKADIQSYFEAPIIRLGGRGSSVLDPLCSARLFLMAYGEIFESERIFPMSFGQGKWQPVVKAEPQKQFFTIMSSLEHYLFDPAFDILERQCLMLLDYWFSTIPLLSDTRIFDTVLHHDIKLADRRRLSHKQMNVRSLLAGLSGYAVWQERGSKLIHKDPELEEYVRERLAAIEMVPEYYRLLDFIRKHKDNSLDASEAY